MREMVMRLSYLHENALFNVVNHDFEQTQNHDTKSRMAVMDVDQLNTEQVTAEGLLSSFLDSPQTQGAKISLDLNYAQPLWTTRDTLIDGGHWGMRILIRHIDGLAGKGSLQLAEGKEFVSRMALQARKDSISESMRRFSVILRQHTADNPEVAISVLECFKRREPVLVTELWGYPVVTDLGDEFGTVEALANELPLHFDAWKQAMAGSPAVADFWKRELAGCCPGLASKWQAHMEHQLLDQNTAAPAGSKKSTLRL